MYDKMIYRDKTFDEFSICVLYTKYDATLSTTWQRDRLMNILVVLHTGRLTHETKDEIEYFICI